MAVAEAEIHLDYKRITITTSSISFITTKINLTFYVAPPLILFASIVFLLKSTWISAKATAMVVKQGDELMAGIIVEIAPKKATWGSIAVKLDKYAALLEVAMEKAERPC